MGRRLGGVIAAALALVTGGIAGGAVAFAVSAMPAQHGDVPQAIPDAVATVERTRTVSERTPAPAPVASAASTTTDTAQRIDIPVTAAAGTTTTALPGCPAAITGTTPGAPAITSPLGVAGTNGADMEAFAAAYNATRVAHCLAPVPLANFRYDGCMEQRLFWMAEDPSTDTSSAWGHIGSVRSDGVPSVGCDGNLAGGWNNVGETFARKWWDSTGHRLSLYVPSYTGSMSSVCIYFAVTHGGVPNEPPAFARAAARWGDCTMREPGDPAWAKVPVASQ